MAFGYRTVHFQRANYAGRHLGKPDKIFDTAFQTFQIRVRFVRDQVFEGVGTLLCKVFESFSGSFSGVVLGHTGGKRRIVGSQVADKRFEPGLLLHAFKDLFGFVDID